MLSRWLGATQLHLQSMPPIRNGPTWYVMARYPYV
jgi:hypothetical protein